MYFKIICFFFDFVEILGLIRKESRFFFLCIKLIIRLVEKMFVFGCSFCFSICVDCDIKWGFFFFKISLVIFGV